MSNELDKLNETLKENINNFNVICEKSKEVEANLSKLLEKFKTTGNKERVAEMEKDLETLKKTRGNLEISKTQLKDMYQSFIVGSFNKLQQMKDKAKIPAEAAKNILHPINTATGLHLYFKEQGRSIAGHNERLVNLQKQFADFESQIDSINKKPDPKVMIDVEEKADKKTKSKKNPAEKHHHAAKRLSKSD